MAQTIKLKRSATSGAIPTTSQLELGEVAINTYDGKMYIKKNVGGTESIVEIGTGSAADGVVQEYQYTATASQTTFSGSDDNSETLAYESGAIQVFLNGVLLDVSTDYTATNGTSVVLTNGAALDDLIQIFAFKKKISDGSVTVDTFTGDNSTTAFTLTLDPGDENNTRVFIDGVYQSKDNYSVSGTTLTFSTAPPTDTAIEIEIGNRNVTLDTTANLDFPDSVKLRLGTDQDLEIYHDGSNSFIKDAGTGSLAIQASQLNIDSSNGSEYQATFIENGAVSLYYDGSKKFETTNDGVSVTGDVEATGEIIGDLRGATLFKAQAGEALTKGEVVYISGVSGNTTVVSKADADDASKMPAFGLVAASASSGNPVDIYTAGILADIDTSSFSEGDELFVSTTAGALTATAPTGESAALQKIGKVTRSDATGGRIFIIGAGRSNAVPNLNEGRLFVGNSSNQAVADDTVHVDIANSRVGIGTSSPRGELEIESSGVTNLYLTRNDATINDTNSLGVINFSGTEDGSTYIDGAQIYAKAEVSWSSGDYKTGLAFATNSGNSLTEKMRLDRNGRLGIGTSSPAYGIVLDDTNYDTSATRRISIQSASHGANAGYKFDLESANGTARSAGYYFQPGDTAATTYLGLSADNASDQLIVTAEGNVGIGASNLSAGMKLDVRGSVRIGDASSSEQDIHFVNSTTEWQVGTNNGGNGTDSNQFYFYEGGNYRLTVQKGGNVGIGTSAPSGKFHVSSGDQALGFDSGVWVSANPTNYTAGRGAGITMQNADVYTGGIYGIRETNSWQGALAFYTHTSSSGNTFDTTFTEKMRISSNGNVGIGNTSPTSNLTIGSAQSDGLEFTYDGTNAYRNRIVNYWNSSTDTRMDFEIGRTGGVAPTTVMSVGYNNNVGIGTSSPNAKLHIVGSGQFDMLTIERTSSTPGIKFVSGGDPAGDFGFQLMDNDEWWVGTYDDSASTYDYWIKGTSDIVRAEKPISSHTDAGTKQYSHLCTGSFYQGTGAIVIDTNIPAYNSSGNGNMFSIKIRGYEYARHGSIDMNLGGYVGENNHFSINYSGTYVPEVWIDYVRLCKNDTTGKLAIVLGQTTSQQVCEIAVVDFIQGFSNENESYANGWSMSSKTSLSGYSFFSTCEPRISSPRPGFHAYLSASTSFSAGTAARILGSTTYNRGGHYNTSNGRFTAPSDGVYHFDMSLMLSNSTINLTYVSAEVRVNGGTRYIGGWFNKTTGGNNNNSTYGAATGSVTIPLGRNDYVEFICELSAGHSVIGGVAGYTYLSGVQIG